MKLPKGVEVCLVRVFSDIVAIVEANQYVGDLRVGKGTTIDVKVDPSVANRIFGIVMDHKSGAFLLKRDLAKDPIMGIVVEKGSKWLETKVSVKDSKNFIPTTKYPQNHMTLVELDAEKPGLVRIWELALVSQNGLFYVTTQCTYEVQCYSNQGRFSCPFFEIVKPAPMFVGLFFKLFTLELMEKLPPLSEYVPPADPPKAWPDYGRVLWWNCAMQYGAIQTTEGVARIHWSNVKDADGLVRFNTGDMVTYEELGPPFQTYERETNLKLEAFGVRQVV